MDAEEVSQAKFDQRKAGCIQELLTEFITIYPSDEHGDQIEHSISIFEWKVWQDWKDGEVDNVMEVVRLNLACGDDEAAGMALVASIRKAMDEIAAQAVREDMKHG